MYTRRIVVPSSSHLPHSIVVSMASCVCGDAGFSRLLENCHVCILACFLSIQSDITSTKSSLFDTLREGLGHVTSRGISRVGRLLPLWQLALPTIGYRLVHHLIFSLTSYTVHSAHHSPQLQEGRQVRTFIKIGSFPQHYTVTFYTIFLTHCGSGCSLSTTT